VGAPFWKPAILAPEYDVGATPKHSWCPAADARIGQYRRLAPGGRPPGRRALFRHSKKERLTP
jgi:hypothetical protein